MSVDMLTHTTGKSYEHPCVQVSNTTKQIVVQDFTFFYAHTEELVPIKICRGNEKYNNTDWTLERFHAHHSNKTPAEQRAILRQMGVSLERFSEYQPKNWHTSQVMAESLSCGVSPKRLEHHQYEAHYSRDQVTYAGHLLISKADWRELLFTLAIPASMLEVWLLTLDQNHLARKLRWLLRVSQVLWPAAYYLLKPLAVMVKEKTIHWVTGKRRMRRKERTNSCCQEQQCLVQNSCRLMEAKELSEQLQDWWHTSYKKCPKLQRCGIITCNHW